MNILLVCSAGMSTSLLVSKMRKEATAQEKDYKIWALSIDDAYEEYDDADVILLGPQVTFLLDEVKNESKKPVEVIERTNYGLCNGKAVLVQAETLFKESEEK
ncbi:PTS sugar transporter subunit IIB [Clostridium oceanicum]|uniref:PTS lichenan transporter subunit IIB n=1 Tax=Clostridium oceanicum TaxID=1543 RepID=A0ABN1JCK3_9CLOT